jgi:NHLM bacteriocin system ABC transporter ATP-binding protein
MSLTPESEVVTAGRLAFSLARPGGAWRVVQGELDVFAARGGASASARWRPLLTLGTGAVLPGVLRGEDTFARPAAGAVVEPLEISALTEADTPGLDLALEALLGALRDELPPREFVPLTPGTAQELEPGTVVRPLEPVVWVEVRDGALELHGRLGALTIAPGVEVALGEGDWLTSTTPATVVAHTTADLLAAGRLPPALEELASEAGRIVEQRLARAEEAEDEHLRRRETQDREVAEATSRAFGALLREGNAPTTAGGPLLETARVVAAVDGIELRAPAMQRDDLPLEEQLRVLARASRVHVRPVALERGWYRDDVGPLVAQRADDGAVVALVRRGSSYELRDAASGERRRVTRASAAELAPTAYAFHATLPDRSLRLRDLLAFGLQGLRGDLLAFVLAAVFVAAIGLLTPVVTGSILGTLVPDGELGLVAALCVVLVVAAVVAALVGAIQNLSALRAEGRAVARMQSAVWARVMALPAAFHRGRSTGDLATRALAVMLTEEATSAVGLRAALAVIVIVVNLGLICVYDVALAAYAFAVVAVVAAIAALVLRRQLTLQREGFRRLRVLQSRTFQIIDRVGKLRAAAAEERAFAHWAQAFLRTRRMTLLARSAQNRFTAFTAAVALCAVAGAFVIAGQLDVDAATYLAFNVAFAQVSASLVLLVTALVSLSAVVPLLESLRPIVQGTPEVVAVKTEPGELSGAIEVSGVSFRYDAEGPLVLDDVSLRAEPGEFVAVVGPSGCGKSTLLRMLLGFETPDAGAVLYDGQDLDGLDATGVRRQCGVVLQDGRLLDGDIYANVAGSGRFSEDDAWNALRMAGLAADVEAMPMGLSTLVSGQGGTLSGGQRQRLMIARALVARPRILFLDEATSALDNRTQEIVAESTRRLAATRIVIAHRLSTIREADRIVVMDAGRIAQEGTYAELMTADGLFRSLATRQLV